MDLSFERCAPDSVWFIKVGVFDIPNAINEDGMEREPSRAPLRKDYVLHGNVLCEPDFIGTDEEVETVAKHGGGIDL